MSILHKPRHIPLIRDDVKTETRRIWKPAYNRPVPGSTHMITTSLFQRKSECDCFVQVQYVYPQELGHMTRAQYDWEGGYTRDEFVDIWIELHGAYNPHRVVDVVGYRYIGTTPEVSA